MEIKGDEFVKNVKYQQEKTELEDRLNELEMENGNSFSQASNPYEENNPYASNSISYEEEISRSESELDDIMLGANNDNQNQVNKKKYIILGLILAILFLIVIIIFRLLNNESTVNDFNDKEKIPQEKALDNNIEQQYQKIVNEKLKSIEDMNKKTEEEEKKISESMDLNNIQKEEKAISMPTASQEDIQRAEELKKDIFNIKEEANKSEVVEKKVAPVVKKVEPKVVEKKVTTTVAKVSSNTPSGTFIQVGAFSKSIDSKFLSNLKNSGLSYKLYKVDVKGTMYTKVLVGPYNSRTDALNDMNSVKKQLKINSAYVLKF